MSPQQRETNDACDVTLMQKTSCDGLRIECSFSVEEAKHICSLEKEVRAILFHIHAFVSKFVFIKASSTQYDLCILFLYSRWVNVEDSCHDGTSIRKQKCVYNLSTRVNIIHTFPINISYTAYKA